MDTSPNLERRTTARPVRAVDGFVQQLAAGLAQWCCAFCGRYDHADSTAAAHRLLLVHLQGQHAGWALQAVRAVGDPVVADSADPRV